MNTKEQMLDMALSLFARRGFAAVSVRDICFAIGIRESALYKHFTNKQALFDALVSRYQRTSDAFMQGVGAVFRRDAAEISDAVDRYGAISDMEFLETTNRIFSDFLMQPDVLNFWRMMSIERLNSAEMAAIFDALLIREPLAFQAALFQGLIENGCLKGAEPELLAMEFYMPLLLLYLRMLPCSPGDPLVTECLALAQRHVAHFRSAHDTSGEERNP